MLRKLLRNTVAGYALKALQMFLGLIAIPVLVGRIGADGYGLIVLAGTILGYFAVFDLGMSDALTKFVAEYDAKEESEKVEQVITTSLATFALIGGILCVTVLILIRFGALEIFSVPETLRDDATTIFLLAAGLSLLAWPRLVFQGALRGLQEFVSLNIVIGSGRIVAISLALTLALADYSLPMIFLALHFDVFIAIIVLPMLLRRRLPSWSPRITQVKWATLTMIWSFSFWILLSKIAVLLEYQLDTIIISVALPLSSITAYTVLTYPFRMVQQFSGLAAAAVMPAVSAAVSAKNEGALSLLRLTGARLHNAFLAVMTVTVLLHLEPFLRIWMGEIWLDQIWIAFLAAGFQFLWQSNSFLGQVIVGSGFAKRPAIVAIATGIVNLTLSLVLVQNLGVAGVILGTIIAGLLGMLLFVFWCLPLIGVSLRDYAWEVVLRGQGPIWLTGAFLYAGFFLLDTEINSWLSLIASGISITTISLIVAFLFSTNASERTTALSQFRERFCRTI